MNFDVNREDFKFEIFLREGYAELTTSTRFINCEFWQVTDEKVSPKKYKIFVPNFWNLAPQEQAMSIDCIFRKLGEDGFTIIGFRSTKPEELEIKMVR